MPHRRMQSPRVIGFLAGLVMLGGVSTASAQQATPVTVAALLREADAAFRDEDRDRARSLYLAVLARDSAQTRALFRLAQLAPSAGEALALLRRYTSLEPRDPWGHMAVGDQLGRLRAWDDALWAYRRAEALAPGERDVVTGQARILQQAGRADDAVSLLRRWVAGHPEDGDAWDLSGRAALRAGRPRAAADAFSRAVRLDVAGASSRERAARAAAGSAIDVSGGIQVDTDGNRVERAGGGADVLVRDRVRIGAATQRLTLTDAEDRRTGVDVSARLAWQPASAIRVDIQGGAMTFAGTGRAEGAWSVPQGTARLRWRQATGGAALDVRSERAVLTFSPLLVSNRVTREELRGTLDLPLGPVRLRGGGRAGRMLSSREAANARMGLEGAVIAPIGQHVGLSAQARSLGFARASRAGFFAPRRAETVEAGLQFDAGDDSRVSLSADLGAGAQRVALHGGAFGRFTRALRCWTQAGLSLGPSRILFVEVEAYDSPLAPEGVPTAGNWRFLAASGGLRWALR